MNEFHKVRITTEDICTHRVFLDDVEIHGITDLDLNIEAGCCPVLSLKIFPKSIEVDTEGLCVTEEQKISLEEKKED